VDSDVDNNSHGCKIINKGITNKNKIMNFDKLGTYKRNKVGRFDSFRAAVRRVCNFVIRWSLISGAAYAIFMAGAMFYSTSTVTATTNTVDLFPQKIEALKADVVARLSQCESAGIKDADALVTFDPDHSGKARNIPSFGRMQFKVPTVIQYAKQLPGVTLTDKEAVLLALDGEQAQWLASEIIFKDDGLGNWLNCANKLGLRADVNAIKKLENR
jgi:hypothetical protein